MDEVVRAMARLENTLHEARGEHAHRTDWQARGDDCCAVCGLPWPWDEDGFCCRSLARLGVCACPDREQHIGR